MDISSDSSGECYKRMSRGRKEQKLANAEYKKERKQERELITQLKKTGESILTEVVTCECILCFQKKI